MFNSYQTKTAKITKVQDQAPGIKSFGFDAKISHAPGQIVILSLPGFGEAPFAPCNGPGGNLELCVRNVGKLTNKLHSLKSGDRVGIRGPYGTGWPVGVGGKWQVTSDKSEGENSPLRFAEGFGKASQPPSKKGGEKPNLLMVVGGLGLIPLRTLILGKDRFLGQDAILQIFYGAKTPQEYLFKNEFDQWRKNGIDLQLTIDKGCDDWKGCVGLVTALFDRRNVVSGAKAFLCGPPVMYKSVLRKIQERSFRDKDIYFSLERRMHCGIGVCQHCAVGPYYTCKNGPVFCYSKIKDIPGAI